MGTGKMHVVERGKGQKMEMETTKGGASHLDDMLALRLHDRQPLALDEIVCAAREEILRQWPSDDGRGLWMVGRGTGKIGGEGGSGESEPGEQRAKGAPWAAKQQVNLASPSQGAGDHSSTTRRHKPCHTWPLSRSMAASFAVRMVASPSTVKTARCTAGSVWYKAASSRLSAESCWLSDGRPLAAAALQRWNGDGSHAGQ